MLPDFDGNTFVAFLDISGFKELMKGKKAFFALDRFYQYGYDALLNKRRTVYGLFVSDCGILFARESNNRIGCLISLLEVIKEINQRMIEHEFMLTTSVAYGHFRYQNRIEFEGVEKNAIYGNAYVSAFLDNESGNPKIQPGQCRIVRDNLPGDINVEINQPHGLFRFMNKRGRDKKHYYYYWNVENPDYITEFEKKYQYADKLKHEILIKALSGNLD